MLNDIYIEIFNKVNMLYIHYGHAYVINRLTAYKVLNIIHVK